MSLGTAWRAGTWAASTWQDSSWVGHPLGALPVTVFGGWADPFNVERHNQGRWHTFQGTDGVDYEIVDGVLIIDGSIDPLEMSPVVIRDEIDSPVSPDGFWGNFDQKSVSLEFELDPNYGMSLYIVNDLTYSDEFFGFDIYGGEAYVWVPGVDPLWQVTYDPDEHKAFKISEDAGILYAYYWDGADWIEVASAVSGAWIGDCRCAISGYQDGTPAGGDSLRFMGYNCLTNARSTPQTYYVKAAGSDSNNGTSAGTAWQTVARVNQAFIDTEFIPGDTIQFEAGETFDGPLLITQEFPTVDPLLIKSSSTTPATIDAELGNGIVGIDVAGIEFEYINVVGDGVATNNGDGFLFLNTNSIHRHEYLRLTNCEVEGMGGKEDAAIPFIYEGTGIRIGGANIDDCMGYEDVVIDECLVETCTDNGIWIGGRADAGGAHGNADITITDSIARYIQGEPGVAPLITGNGIRMEDINVGLVENCNAHENGAVDGDHSAGFYVQRCTAVVFRRCAAWENETSTTDDGTGFYVDGGCEDCIIELCYTRLNEGAGILIISGDGNGRDYNRRNIVRFNISENDGQANQYPSIFMYKDPGQPAPYDGEDNLVYSNIVYKNGPVGSVGAPIRVHGQDGAKIMNNIFYSGSDGLRIAEIDNNNTGVQIKGNNWFGTGDFYYNSTNYATLALFRTASGYETGTGTNTDPQFSVPGGGTNPAGKGKTHLIAATVAYILENASSALEDGIDLDAESLSFPVEDFHGHSISAPGQQKKQQGPKHNKKADSLLVNGLSATEHITTARNSAASLGECRLGVYNSGASLSEYLLGLAGASATPAEHLQVIRQSIESFTEHIFSLSNEAATLAEYLQGLYASEETETEHGVGYAAVQADYETLVEILQGIRQSEVSITEHLQGIAVSYATQAQSEQALASSVSTLVEHLLSLSKQVETFAEFLQEVPFAFYETFTEIGTSPVSSPVTTATEHRVGVLSDLLLTNAEFNKGLSNSAASLGEHLLGLYGSALSNAEFLQAIGHSVDTPVEHYGEVVRIVLEYVMYMTQAMEFDLKG